MSRAGRCRSRHRQFPTMLLFDKGEALLIAQVGLQLKLQVLPIAAVHRVACGIRGLQRAIAGAGTAIRERNADRDSPCVESSGSPRVVAKVPDTQMAQKRAAIESAGHGPGMGKRARAPRGAAWIAVRIGEMEGLIREREYGRRWKPGGRRGEVARPIDRFQCFEEQGAQLIRENIRGERRSCCRRSNRGPLWRFSCLNSKPLLKKSRH